tara:strand:- start:1051 stop:1395 length:345 start_codon:yes stop_codon:yes gene_type:complete
LNEKKCILSNLKIFSIFSLKRKMADQLTWILYSKKYLGKFSNKNQARDNIPPTLKKLAYNRPECLSPINLPAIQNHRHTNQGLEVNTKKLKSVRGSLPPIRTQKHKAHIKEAIN